MSILGGMYLYGYAIFTPRVPLTSVIMLVQRTHSISFLIYLFTLENVTFFERRKKSEREVLLLFFLFQFLFLVFLGEVLLVGNGCVGRVV